MTLLLQRMRRGDRDAANQVFTALYDVLRAQARVAMGGRGRSVTLQPTALVHEAFIRLVRQDADWKDRGHFHAAVAKTMRTILIDYAKARARQKRRATGRKLRIDEVYEALHERGIDVLALNEAVERLRKLDTRCAQVVELMFFAGLEQAEVARALRTTQRTVERDWQFARVWLQTQLR